MLATTWVQIIKAGLLMTGATVMTLFVLERVGWNPVDLFNQAADEHPEGKELPGARAELHEPDRHDLARAWRWCSAPRACRTS